MSPKCVNTSNHNMSQRTKCVNTPKNKDTPVGKMCQYTHPPFPISPLSCILLMFADDRTYSYQIKISKTIGKNWELNWKSYQSIFTRNTFSMNLRKTKWILFQTSKKYCITTNDTSKLCINHLKLKGKS